jgi:hypothetical protein
MNTDAGLRNVSMSICDRHEQFIFFVTVRTRTLPGLGKITLRVPVLEMDSTELLKGPMAYLDCCVT